ncbi:DUF3892 domain-containing protein [Dyadobacter sp. LHD-138]|uniref:DUF3892 domain-containing protein n=1 Tax=Dyadobacter sp. LHD-138 TaxID=3071413 RepID=UPI0027E00BC0|nr:DUF3892 domain-containing protein [Dyadobacter sp. LHD-138]MDQ6482576.1 DUF3892 domain-containing protein [Dyadobacter sp. LHD-138]
MSLFRISGVWVNQDDVITHYAFHTVDNSANSASRAAKTTKAEAIRLLEMPGNRATTWIWNYNLAQWAVGEDVSVVAGATGKYLRSNRDSTVTDNLKHLIDFDWIVL